MRKGKMSTIRYKNKRRVVRDIGEERIEKYAQQEQEQQRPPRRRRKIGGEWVEI